MSFFLIFPSLNVYATENCKDPNFDNLIGENYSKLRFHKRFVKYAKFKSPAPAGLFGSFFGDEESNNTICFDMTAHYFTHYITKKNYVMFTTHDDYCDGGNVRGLIVDMEKYRRGKKLKESVVAAIGDGEVGCVKK